MTARATHACVGGTLPFRAARRLSRVILLSLLPTGAWGSVLPAGQPGVASVADPLASALLGVTDVRLDSNPAGSAVNDAQNLDRSRQIEAALAEAIEENQAIQRVLRGVIMPGGPLAGLGELPGVDLRPNVEAAAPSPILSASLTRMGEGGPNGASQGPAAGSAAAAVAVEISDGEDASGPTLREVIRSLVSRAQSAEAVAAQAGDPQAAVDVDGESDGALLPIFDLRARILDSRLLGLALESIIQVNPFDESFSIFGLGHFKFERSQEGSGVLADSSSAFSPALDYRQPGRSQRQASEKIDLLSLVVRFFQSPAGMLIATCAAMLLLVWAAVRIARRAAIR